MAKQDMKFSDVDVIGRCKQCSKPVTRYEQVSGPTGMFCSQECKEKHENFIRNAAALDDRPKRGAPFFRTIRKLIGNLVVFVIGVVIIGAIALNFQIPVLTPFFEWLRGQLGF